jgi:uncharacterized membrane-anchored protein YhcB (DUF1043 family)
MSAINNFLGTIRTYSQVGSWASRWVLENFAFVGFLSFLAVVYITNAHLAERKVREIQKLQKEIKELKWKYESEKAAVMYNSKQTEVTKMVEALQLNTSNERRKRIVVE